MSDSNNLQVPSNGLQVNAGPVTVAASGSVAVQVILAFFVICSCMYVVYTNDKRSGEQLAMLTIQHNAIMVNISALRESSDNMFLSSMLPNERKKDLPAYIQDRARALVERKAERITEKQGPAQAEQPEQGPFQVK